MLYSFVWLVGLVGQAVLDRETLRDISMCNGSVQNGSAEIVKSLTRCHLILKICFIVVVLALKLSISTINTISVIYLRILKKLLVSNIILMKDLIATRILSKKVIVFWINIDILFVNNSIWFLWDVKFFVTFVCHILFRCILFFFLIFSLTRLFIISTFSLFLACFAQLVQFFQMRHNLNYNFLE